MCLLGHISPMERLFILKLMSRTQRATKVKNFVGICLKLFKSYAVKHERKSQYANYSDLPAVQLSLLDKQQAPEGTQRLSTTFSLAQTPCLLMPLAHVGARTESTTCYSYNVRRGQFPRTHIGIVHKTRRNAVCVEGFAL